MTVSDLLVNPLFPRTLVIGVFGGVSLALTARFSRREPMLSGHLWRMTLLFGSGVVVSLAVALVIS